jgi:hypothetical protein
MSYESAFDEAVSAMGGRAAGAISLIAEGLGETIQTVSNWRTRGVPPNRCKAFEAVTGISVRKLRPHDWRDYWPEPPPTRRKRTPAAASPAP